jgi:hypothetical protein
MTIIVDPALMTDSTINWNGADVVGPSALAARAQATKTSPIEAICLAITVAIIAFIILASLLTPMHSSSRLPKNPLAPLPSTTNLSVRHDPGIGVVGHGF